MKLIRIFLLAVFSGLVLYAPFSYRSAFAGFRAGKVLIDSPHNPAWATDHLPTENLEAVFGQPFFYLSHGGQSFVFQSQDGRYVIKLFRRSTKEHPWRRALRNRFLNVDKLEPEQKTDRLFSACKLAFERAKDLTGLVYIHLNSTAKILPEVCMRDRMGRAHEIDLNKCSFAVQYKGTPVQVAFEQALERNDHAQFVRLVEQFAALLRERTARHLGNTDRKVRPNFGFLPDRAIEWDFGNYWVADKFAKPILRAKEIRVFSEHLLAYLNRVAPDWAADAKEILER